MSKDVENNTIKKAEEENIPIMLSIQPAFEFIGKLYNLINLEKND